LGYNRLKEDNLARDPGSTEYASIRRYAERLRLLREIDRAVLGALSTEQTADAALGGLRQLVHCLRASVALFDPDADEVSLLATCSDSPLHLKAGARTSLSHAFFFGDSVRGLPHVIEDLGSTGEAHPWVEAMRAEGVRAYASGPLRSEGRVIGALSFGLEQAGPPSEAAMEIAADIADRLALAIVNGRLREQVVHHAEQLEARVAVRTNALRESEARFRAIFEAAPLGILLANRDGRVLQSNPALASMLGHPARELHGMSLPEIGASDDARRNLRTHFDKLMAGGTHYYRMEVPLRHRDGRTVWAFLTMARTRASSEAAELAVGMVEDVTEERQTRAALVHAERQAIAGRLGASLAHEINNPLQSIIGCVGLAEESMPEGSEAGRYLEVAHSELYRVARTVAQLRDLHRETESDQLEPVDLNSLMSQLLTLNEPRFAELGIEAEWKPAASLPAVPGVPDRLRQVFLNLILNAIDAMPQGGRLSVRTSRSRKPGGARVTVGDTGKGIPEAVLPRLFEPFYSTKKQGLGLGLFTSRSIVEQHKGTIQVRSRPGKGTTFTVWLPRSVSGTNGH
jgi:PAS domain S-box-containing protein